MELWACIARSIFNLIPMTHVVLGNRHFYPGFVWQTCGADCSRLSCLLCQLPTTPTNLRVCTFNPLSRYRTRRESHFTGPQHRRRQMNSILTLEDISIWAARSVGRPRFYNGHLYRQLHSNSSVILKYEVALATLTEESYL